MKLYLTPGTCAQGCHIALIEAGQHFATEIVDLPTHRTGDGHDFYAVNPKGYVPALVLDDGTMLTETTAISYWAAAQAPELLPEGAHAEARLIAALAFVATEIHRPFMRMFFSPAEAEKAAARAAIEKRLALVAAALAGPYWLGARFTPADAALWVMVGWALHHALAVPKALRAYHGRVAARPAVQAALRSEGLAA
jgi:glutathione S-transferase